MKKIFLLIPYLLLLIDAPAYAQQDPQFSQYNFNKLAFNPAYAGMRQAFCVSTLGRQQWTGFPGAPKNLLLSTDLFLRSFGGVGLVLINDQLGFDRTNIVKASGSFHLPVGPGTLGLGLEASAIQKTMGNAWVYNDSGDPSIPMNGASSTIWDMGLGVYYQVEKQLFFGISTTHIPQNIFKYNSGSSSTAFHTTRRHYFLTAGCSFNVTPEIDLQPSLLAKTDASATQIDFDVIALWRDFVWAGGSYRLTDAVVVMAGIQRMVGEKSTLKIGYSYDITTSSLKNYSTGTHELFISICTPIPDKPRNTSHRDVRHMWE